MQSECFLGRMVYSFGDDQTQHFLMNFNARSYLQSSKKEKVNVKKLAVAWEVLFDLFKISFHKENMNAAD